MSREFTSFALSVRTGSTLGHYSDWCQWTKMESSMWVLRSRCQLASPLFAKVSLPHMEENTINLQFTLAVRNCVTDRE